MMAVKARAFVLRNGIVLHPGGAMTPADVLIADGKIRRTGVGLRADEELDVEECYVLPGFIDLHTHGIGMVSTDRGRLADYAAIEASRGATTFYPTLFGPPEASILNLRRYFEETDYLRTTPQIGGFRLESPYLARTGGGVSKDLAPITGETTRRLLDAGEGFVKIWDVSPELPGALECIRALSDMGIVCSLAHTRASIEQARKAVDAGAQLVTHLFDTFELPDDTHLDPGVYPAGIIDYFLVEDRVMCEIIGDGTHVHPLLVEKAFRCKSPERIVFVTDSNYGAGLPTGEYLLPGNWGKVRIDGCNNGVRMVDRDMILAGSALTPIDSFRNAVRLFGKDISTASRICSRTPARLMGLNKGEIAPEWDADIIILNKEFDVDCTICGGKVIFQRDSASPA